jgi:DNA topoisomerase-1
MKILQKLFEGGHITYHRTDSLILSEDSKKEIQQLVSETYGDEYYQNNVYANKDDAQAAHEPIRPTHMDIKSIEGTSIENRLYQMIYNRTIASQMAPASVDIKTVKIGMNNSDRIFLVKAENITYKGFLVIYEKDKNSGKSRDKDTDVDVHVDVDPEGADEENEMEVDNSALYEILDTLKVGDLMKYKIIESIEKFSKPPQGRYT